MKKKKHNDNESAETMPQENTAPVQETAETQWENATEADPAAVAPQPENPSLSPQEQLEQELAETKEKLLYLQADYQNYRKRTVRELADARKLGITTTLDPFLRVFDFLNMADTAAHQSDNIEAIRQGITMIIGEYRKAFDDLGVSPVESVGKPFDPTWQEAVAQEASETIPEGSVIREWSPAYRMGETWLRAAKVVVSTGAPAAEEQKADQ
ncbi:MAG: nucleotide exchange factor GrpE [Lentisphaeria bacterium]|nr:nucleotide exchange factor GrpE [Lentisphaeria bacterium]